MLKSTARWVTIWTSSRAHSSCLGWW